MLALDKFSAINTNKFMKKIKFVLAVLNLVEEFSVNKFTSKVPWPWNQLEQDSSPVH